MYINCEVVWDFSSDVKNCLFVFLFQPFLFFFKWKIVCAKINFVPLQVTRDTIFFERSRNCLSDRWIAEIIILIYLKSPLVSQNTKLGWPDPIEKQSVWQKKRYLRIDRRWADENLPSKLAEGDRFFPPPLRSPPRSWGTFQKRVKN